MLQTIRSRLLRRAILFGVVFGVLLFVIDVVLDLLVASHQLPSFMFVVSDGVTAVIATALVLLVLIMRAEQQASSEARLRTIAEMNHHIRNALQVISYCGTGEREREMRLMQGALDRIEWALRELLPATVDPQHHREEPPKIRAAAGM